MAGTVGTSWTFTLPNDVPTITGQTMVFNTSGTAEFRYPDKFTATKTANYTATGDETVIRCDPTTGGASFTVTLPAASTMTGKELTIVKVDAGLTYTVTIDANSSETILPSLQSSQLTYILYTQYESVTIKCDGLNWYVVQHRADTNWTAYTPTISGGGTPTGMAAYWRRVAGRDIEVKFYFLPGTTTADAAKMTLPTNVIIDTTVVTASAAEIVGQCVASVTTTQTALPSATVGPFIMFLVTSDTSNVYVADVTDKDDTLFTVRGGSSIWNSSGDVVSGRFRLAVSGWNP